MGNILINTAYIIYALALWAILLYTVSQYYLFFFYLKNPKKHITTDFKEQDLPNVTIQLPIYNEKYVIEDLFDCISKINYPKEKLQLQVLDDSTDESRDLNQIKTAELIKLGFNAEYIHRHNRENFKAGALKNGLETASGEFIAIFDADFRPSSDWLLNTIKYFSNKKIGLVQTKWTYSNRNYSIFTGIQAMALDHHFNVEQIGRNRSGQFINFNGTAGIWRKECVVDAGNWHDDTLTEDLDLSIRAQSRSWEFIYVPDIETISDLPFTLSGIRSQQFRWNKGGAQNLLKFTKSILKDSKFSFAHKLLSISHLFNSSVFLWVFLVCVFSVFNLVFPVNNTLINALLFPSMFLKFNGLFILFMFAWVQLKSGEKVLVFIKNFIMFFPVIMALAFHNALAVLEAYLGIKSDFVRTPKFAINKESDSFLSNYHVKSIKWNIYLELFLAVFFASAAYYGYYIKDFSFLPLHLTLSFGYFLIFIKTINE